MDARACPSPRKSPGKFAGWNILLFRWGARTSHLFPPYPYLYKFTLNYLNILYVHRTVLLEQSSLKQEKPLAILSQLIGSLNVKLADSNSRQFASRKMYWCKRFWNITIVCKMFNLIQSEAEYDLTPATTVVFCTFAFNVRRCNMYQQMHFGVSYILGTHKTTTM